MFGKNTETSKETIDSTNEEPGVKRNVIKVKTTQNFSPIRDIKDGIIITKDGRFVKVMEFSAINFNLRSAKERATIIDSFAQAIKLLPSFYQAERNGRLFQKQQTPQTSSNALEVR